MYRLAKKFSMGRRVRPVALTAGALLHRIARVGGTETCRLNTVAFSTELSLRLHQQVGLFRTVGFVTRAAALGHRLVNPLALKGCLFVTPEAQLPAGLYQQVLLVRSMRVVAQGALALR
jgi:hypothetical protein